MRSFKKCKEWTKENVSPLWKSLMEAIKKFFRLIIVCICLIAFILLLYIEFCTSIRTDFFTAIIAIVMFAQLGDMWVRSTREIPKFEACVVNREGEAGTEGVWSNHVRIERYPENHPVPAYYDLICKRMCISKDINYTFGFFSLILTNPKAAHTTIREILVGGSYNRIFASSPSNIGEVFCYRDWMGNIGTQNISGLRNYQNLQLPPYTTMPLNIIVSYKDPTDNHEYWPSPPDIEIEVTDMFGSTVTLFISGIYKPGKNKSKWDPFDEWLLDKAES